MSIVDKHIFLQDNSNFQLIGTNIKNFCVFSIKKTQYQRDASRVIQQVFETFLLVKAVGQNQPDKNIVFSRQKMAALHKLNKQSQRYFLKSQTYYSSFLRHVDLSYCRKLTEVVTLLNINIQTCIQNEWFLLYQVHNYKPQLKSQKQYQLESPLYGGKVLIQHHSFKIKQKSELRVSNLFRHSSQNFYFLTDFLDTIQITDMQMVFSTDSSSIYGLTYKVKDIIILIPFQAIIFEKQCSIKLDLGLESKLFKTCYIQFFGSYCTGVLAQQNKIITARHLLPLSHQKVGTRVVVKKFPYRQNLVGSVTKIGLGNLDIMEIQILEQQNQRKNTCQKIKEKTLVKQYLNDSFSYIQKSQTKQSENYGDFKERFHMQSKMVQPVIEKCLVGDEILALGFGRFSYNINIFNKFEIVLPTVATGIVSKLIQIKNMNVFLKTDAKLYSGFSGSGIWKQNMVGMAVFILKNKNTNSHYNRHNFSYTTQFINELRKNKDNKLSTLFNKEIEQFDKIQTRDSLKLIDKAKPKL